MIKAGFILLTLLMAAIAFFSLSYAAGKAYSAPEEKKGFTRKAAIVLVLWLIYISLVSFTGILTVASFPPRIPLFFIIPAFSFMAYFFASGKFKPIIAAMPASWLVYFQSFRIIVELLLWRLFVEGLLPRSATFEGYNYEIVIGITALLVGYFGYTKPKLPALLIALWNVAGLITLAIVVFIFISHAYAPSLWADTANFSMESFGSFPYTLLAGFLMPLAVFMHVFSLVKLKNKNLR
jgi:hypothetical protein